MNNKTAWSVTEPAQPFKASGVHHFGSGTDSESSSGTILAAGTGGRAMGTCVPPVVLADRSRDGLADIVAPGFRIDWTRFRTPTPRSAV
jgi:hypothetical protein